MAELFITAAGKAEKEERLRYLKNEKRPEVLEKLKVARDFGDLSENAEYDAAKKEQSILETEIASIEETLRKARIIESTDVKKDTVGVGNVVTVFDEDVNERAKTNVSNSFDKILALENLVIAFRHAEIKEF